MTLEKVLLSAAKWELTFDEDGMGCAYCDEEDAAPILLDDVFAKQVYLSDEDGLVVVENGKSVWSLTNKLRMHEVVKVEAAVGHIMAPVHFSVAYMAMPRQGCKLYWNCSEVYKVLGMKACGNEPSKWFYKSHGGWRKWWESGNFHSHHVLLTTQSATACSLNIGRPLPFPGASTFALVALLARWCGADWHAGGLREPPRRNAAQELLHGLIRCSLLVAPMEFKMHLRDNWTMMVPLSQPRGPFVMLRASTQQPKISPTDWLKQAADDNASWAKVQSWCNDMHLPGPEVGGFLDHHWSVCELLTMSVCLCMSFFWQLACGVAFHIEKTLFTTMQRGKQVRGAFDVQCVNVADAMKMPHRLDAVLLNHVLSGSEASREFDHVSVATDKANCNGQNLSAVAIVFPSNEAVIAVPQASMF